MTVPSDRKEPCPAGDGCALNKGAVKCKHCGRNWPPDETWTVPSDRKELREWAHTPHVTLGFSERQLQVQALLAVVERHENALRQIRDLPNEHDLMHNPHAKASWYIADAALAGTEEQA